MFLVVSEPARFAEETLGTLTVGYALDDGVARQLASVTHSEVNIILGRALVASSMAGGTRRALAAIVAAGQSPAPGVAAARWSPGGGEYVAGACARRVPDRWEGNGRRAGSRRLQDWAPMMTF